MERPRVVPPDGPSAKMAEFLGAQGLSVSPALVEPIHHAVDHERIVFLVAPLNPVNTSEELDSIANRLVKAGEGFQIEFEMFPSNVDNGHLSVPRVVHVDSLFKLDFVQHTTYEDIEPGNVARRGLAGKESLDNRGSYYVNRSMIIYVMPSTEIVNGIVDFWRSVENNWAPNSQFESVARYCILPGDPSLWPRRDNYMYRQSSGI